MNLRLSVLAVFACISLAGSPMRAQVGMLNRRTEFAIIYGPGLNGNDPPLRGVVLWTGAPDWAQPRNDLERQRFDSVMAVAQVLAKAEHGSVFGQGIAYGVQHMSPHTITVEGRRFEMTREDSVLVMMVRVPSGNAPRIVTTARLPAVDGLHFDFTLEGVGLQARLVPVPYQTLVRVLTDYLQQSPAVSAFLR